MLEIISEYFYCLIHVLTLTFVAMYLSKERVNLKRVLLIASLYAILNYVVTGVISIGGWEFIVINVVSLLFDCFYVSCILFKISKDGIFYATLVNFLNIFSVNSIIYISDTFIGFDHKITLINSIERLIMVVLINLLVICISVVLNKLNIIPNREILNTKLELFVLLNIIIYSAMVIIYNIGVIDLVDLITVLVLILLILWATFLKILSMYVETTIKNEELIMEEISNKYIDKYIEFYNHESENLKKLKHDLKNHQVILENIDKFNNYDKYIDDMFSEINGSNYIQTGNIYIDACLYAKQQEYSEITFNYDISVNDLVINEKDLTSLLFNLIDNACNEAMKYDKHISIIIKYYNGILLIIVKNKCLSKPNFISTKGKGHGYGLKIIKNIVNKYNGDLLIDHQNNQVIFNIKINI